MYKVSYVSYEKSRGNTTHYGKIIYRHPKNYFVTLEFQGKMGKFRESYHPSEIQEV